MNSWHNFIKEEQVKPYMLSLKSFLQSRKEKTSVYPKESEYFRAFDLTPLDSIKVVILGQDPYHGKGQAHGLSFSVQKGVGIPPSLKNIYTEISRDTGASSPQDGFLEDWAKQGVLLLNTVLTVEEGQAGAHRGKGWEEFTDKAIQTISQDQEHVVFMLWGMPARNKKNLIDSNKHLILEAPHPSPLSAYRGFIGCGHFSKANQYLLNAGKTPIQWFG